MQNVRKWNRNWKIQMSKEIWVRVFLFPIIGFNKVNRKNEAKWINSLKFILQSIKCVVEIRMKETKQYEKTKKKWKKKTLNKLRVQKLKIQILFIFSSIFLLGVYWIQNWIYYSLYRVCIMYVMWNFLFCWKRVLNKTGCGVDAWLSWSIHHDKFTFWISYGA